MQIKFWVLVVVAAWFLAQRKPTVIDVYDIDSWTCKSDLFVPQTSSSKFMSGVCRRVLVEHQDMVTSVFDCGPDLPTGETVVFLHGFPDNPQTFKKQIEAFAGAGYRVIIPTLRGYEINSQSPKGYHITQFAMDIMCITEAFGVEEFHLVGHDWGAVIAYTMSVYFPSNIKSLTSVAVPPQMAKYDKALRDHPDQLINSWYMFFFQVPFLPEFLISRGYLVPTLYKHWSPNYDWKDTQHLKEVLDTLEMPGVATAAVQYYRENVPYMFSLSVLKLFGPPDPRHPVLGDVVDIPVLLISGESDGCIKTEFYDIPFEYTLNGQQVNATVARLSGGHFVHYENPQAFNEVVLNFLSEHTKKSADSSENTPQ